MIGKIVSGKGLMKGLAVIIVLLALIVLGTAGADINHADVPAQDSAQKFAQNPAQDLIVFKTEFIEITNDQGQNYFVNYRIKREQYREERKEMLRALLESDLQSTKEEVQKQWLAYSKKIAEESEIENALKMRGFKDAVTEINGGRVSVMILAELLSREEIGLIKDLAANITGVSREKIEVTARS